MWLDNDMTNTATTTATATDYIDAVMEAGFMPADSDEFPTWVADRWEAGIDLAGGRLLLVGTDQYNETLTLSLQTPSGVIIEEMPFRLNEDGTLSTHQAAAFAAVTAAWLAA